MAYFAPTYKNLTEFWREAARVLRPVTARANAAEHRVDLVTGGIVDMWSLDSPEVARGRRYARVVLDEVAMVPRLAVAWDQVIRSTLADYSGDAWFMSTPKGYNDYHILYQYGQRDAYPDWASWQMRTATNPHISPAELASLERDLPSRVFRQEIQALFEAENEGALWSREWIDATRVPAGTELDLRRVVVALDPSGSRRGDEVGLVVVGIDQQQHAYVLADHSAHLGPDEWAQRALSAYDGWRADAIIAEANFGGEMVQSTIDAMAARMGIQPNVVLTHASRGKVVRAEPCAVLSMQGRVHHVGHFPELENELVSWTPLDAHSPGRLDACLVAGTLVTTQQGEVPIEMVRPGMRVLTRRGYCRVRRAACTGRQRPVLTATFSDGRTITGTAEHPVWVEGKGFLPLDALVWPDIIQVCDEKPLSSMAQPLSAIQMRPSNHTRSISGPMSGARAVVALARFTARYGRLYTGLFRLGMRSITRTAIPLTTPSTILSACPRKSTRSATHPNFMRRVRSTLRALGQRPKRGTRALPAMPGMPTTRDQPMLGASLVPMCALSADAPLSRATIAAGSASVHAPASSDGMSNTGATLRAGPAWSAVPPSPSRSPRNSRPARVCVRGLSDGGRADVYNIEVEGTPEYYANRILVHNCVWALTELLLDGGPAGVWIA